MRSRKSPKPNRRSSRASSSAKPTCAPALTSKVSAAKPGSRCTKTPLATPSRAGKAPSPISLPSQPGRTLTRFPTPGLYDGCVGVLGGLEAIRVLQQLGFKPRRSIELVIFTAEEPTRFGIGCLGSRMMAGVLSPDAGHRPARQGRPRPRRVAQSSRIHWLPRIGSTFLRPLPPVRRIAHRTRPIARAGRH